jgi:hypothetical protein
VNPGSFSCSRSSVITKVLMYHAVLPTEKSQEARLHKGFRGASSAAASILVSARLLQFRLSLII